MPNADPMPNVLGQFNRRPVRNWFLYRLRIAKRRVNQKSLIWSAYPAGCAFFSSRSGLM